jgi:hypothetical protein
MQQARKLPNPLVKLYYIELYLGIPISESKFRFFRFETAGSISLTLIYEMHSIADPTRLTITLMNMRSI